MVFLFDRIYLFLTGVHFSGLFFSSTYFIKLFGNPTTDSKIVVTAVFHFSLIVCIVLSLSIGGLKHLSSGGGGWKKKRI